MSAVKVPEEFARLGFTGLFHTTSAMGQAATERYLQEAPCLLRTPGWMVLSVEQRPDGAGTATLVRRDMGAVCDTVFGGTS